MEHDHEHHEKSSGIKAYQPLIAIAGIVLLAAWALTRTGLPFMQGFMGLFFCQFALFKFFDLNGFADGFSTYDIVAKKSRAYAYAYPFMELALGLGYVSLFTPWLVYLLTVVLMAVSAVGVFRNMGKKISCACLGTVLKVPLSTVSLVENVGMGIMAAWMLLKV
jgi:hypothetical protein